MDELFRLGLTSTQAVLNYKTGQSNGRDRLTKELGLADSKFVFIWLLVKLALPLWPLKWAIKIYSTFSNASSANTNCY